jgi:hypothetical protein
MTGLGRHSLLRNPPRSLTPWRNAVLSRLRTRLAAATRPQVEPMGDWDPRRLAPRERKPLGAQVCPDISLFPWYG